MLYLLFSVFIIKSPLTRHIHWYSTVSSLYILNERLFTAVWKFIVLILDCSVYSKDLHSVKKILYTDIDNCSFLWCANTASNADPNLQNWACPDTKSFLSLHSRSPLWTYYLASLLFYFVIMYRTKTWPLAMCPRVTADHSMAANFESKPHL